MAVKRGHQNMYLCFQENIISTPIPTRSFGIFSFWTLYPRQKVARGKRRKSGRVALPGKSRKTHGRLTLEELEKCLALLDLDRSQNFKFCLALLARIKKKKSNVTSTIYSLRSRRHSAALRSPDVCPLSVYQRKRAVRYSSVNLNYVYHILT